MFLIRKPLLFGKLKLSDSNIQDKYDETFYMQSKQQCMANFSNIYSKFDVYLEYLNPIIVSSRILIVC
jgi:hypothetical protein